MVPRATVFTSRESEGEGEGEGECERRERRAFLQLVRVFYKWQAAAEHKYSGS